MRYTRKYVETALRGIAAERPAQINPHRVDSAGCAYNGPNGSHCIAGQFLANEGITVPPTCEGQDIAAVTINLGVEMALDADEPLTDAQSVADTMVPWGEVIKAVISR